jgi:hypothetical protein
LTFIGHIPVDFDNWLSLNEKEIKQKGKKEKAG